MFYVYLQKSLTDFVHFFTKILSKQVLISAILKQDWGRKQNDGQLDHPGNRQGIVKRPHEDSTGAVKEPFLGPLRNQTMLSK